MGRCVVMFVVVLEVLLLERRRSLLLQDDVNVRRLAELVAQVVAVVADTREDSYFTQAQHKHMYALSAITRRMLLLPVAGVLLLVSELSRNNDTADVAAAFVSALASSHVYDPVKLQYLCSPEMHTNTQQEQQQQQDYSHYYQQQQQQQQQHARLPTTLCVNGITLHMTETAAERLQRLLTAVCEEKERQVRAEQRQQLVRSSELCTICYTVANDTTFVPCGHRSCHGCVTRSMRRNNKCFYCNQPITKLVREGGGGGESEGSEGE